MLIREQRLQRGIQAMRDQDVDMWIAFGRALSSHGEPMLQYLLTFDMGGPIAVVLTRAGERIAVNSRMETEELESMGIFTSVMVNNDGLDGMKAAIAELVRSKAPRNIALNFSQKDVTADGLSFTGYTLLTEAFRMAAFNGEILSSQRLMKQLRSARSTEEVARIRHAVREAMKIYEEARLQMRKGMSGMDIQRLFQSLIDGKGYGYSWPKYGNPFNSIGTKSSYLCKRPAADVFIEPGDVINVDLGININGSSSDNQRTFYALRDGETKPPEEVQRAFDALGEVNRVLAERMRTGVKAGEILRYANEVLVRRGYPAREGAFGHEIGFWAHDGVVAPCSARSEPDVDSTFLEGMTFTLEPAIITSRGRVCREEVIAVTKDGGEVLSTPQDGIWLIP